MKGLTQNHRDNLVEALANEIEPAKTSAQKAIVTGKLIVALQHSMWENRKAIHYSDTVNRYLRDFVIGSLVEVVEEAIKRRLERG